MTVTLPTTPTRVSVRPGLSDKGLTRVEADRLARVLELRQAVLDGTYEVPATDVADAMITSAARS